MKTVVITGAAGGLGGELVKRYLPDSRVFALDIEFLPELRALAETEENLNVYACDITSTDSVRQAFANIREAGCRRIDRLYNNAGVMDYKEWVGLDETDLDRISATIDTNAVGCLRVLKKALPLLGEGSILVYTSSEAGSLAACETTINYGYHMSKAAMNMAARIADNDLRRSGVRTLIFHPGRMRTKNMGGPHSDITPGEAADGIVGTVEAADTLPEDKLFMDYLGRDFPW